MSAHNHMLSYELRIGVTGHRHLSAENLPQIEQAVTRVLEHIGDTLAAATAEPYGPCGSPQTGMSFVDNQLSNILEAIGFVAPSPDRVPPDRQTTLQWVVVSPLAKGSDRLVTKAVLEGLPEKIRQRSPQPARLEVILPMPGDNYRNDFDTESDLQEFESLLARANELHTLNADFEQRPDCDTLEVRQAAYEDAGRAVVDMSEILLAIWDGEPASGRGGTAEIVEYAVDSGKLVLWISSQDPTSPVQVLKRNPTRLSKTGTSADYHLKPLPTQAKEFSIGFHRLSAYQRDPLHPRVKEEIPDWIEHRNTVAQDSPEVLSALKSIDEVLLPHYVRTDALAIMYQKLFFNAANAVYICSVAAVAVVVIQILFFPKHTWLIAFEILAMLVALVLVRVSYSEQWKEKWQHDRHLAEWLRRQHFTWLLHRSLTELREDIIDPRPYPGAEEWFERAFRPLFVKLRNEIKTPLPLEPVKRVLVQCWIEEQADWHGRQIKRHRKAGHRAHAWNWRIFLATLVAAGLHIAGVGHGEGEGPEAEGILSHLITLSAILLPAIGAALHARAALNDHERLASRSEQVEPVLRGLVDRAEVARNHEELAWAVAEANHLLALESDDWWISIGGQAPLMPV